MQPLESNYLRQFYKERSSPEGTDPVEVTAPGTTANINAALLTGGQITGLVTSADTGERARHIATLVGVPACAPGTSSSRPG